MQNIAKGLIGLSALAFVLAVIGSKFGFQLLGCKEQCRIQEAESITSYSKSFKSFVQD